jgi:pimeloyl-ACP methyl ester carboxylesterase
MAAVGAGNYALAADRFLTGVIGPDYPLIVQARLGVDAFDRLTRDARFFFTNEILAAVEWGMKPDLAARITARTLLVVGEQSGEVTHAFEETAAILRELLPAARTVVLPGAGHGMPLQDPAAVAQLIADFVRA